MSTHDLVALTEAARRAPKDAARWTALGVALRERGRSSDSAQALLQAVRLRPTSVEASFQLSLTLEAMGERDGACACLERVCQLDPRRFDARRRLAFLLVGLGRPNDATKAYEAALALRPSAQDVVLELGALRSAVGDAQGAIACYRRALEACSTLDDVALELGHALLLGGELEEAAVVYKCLLARRPELAAAHAGLGNTMKESAMPAAATACYRRAVELAPYDAVLHGNLLYTAAYDPEYSAAAIHEEARRFGERHTRQLLAESLPHLNERNPERRLRVGYVSSDFREHVCSFYLEPLFRHHDRGAIELYCYSNTFPRDSWTERYRRHAAVFREIVGIDDDAAAALVRADAVDILVDLGMHTSRARPLLFARKPAPIQLTWLAYVGTTGNFAMDYRFTDPYLDPESTGALPYTEKSWRLPRSFWCYAPLSPPEPPTPLPALTNGYVTFGSLASYSKVNDGTLKVWAQVLNGVPGARLLLHVPHGAAQDRTLDILEAQGVARSRVELVPRQSRPQYLRSYDRIDVCLDALPYNGLTTALDAAFRGVPTLTLVGATAMGRAGLSVASNLGLSQLVARTEPELVAAARALTRDLAALAELRSSLLARLEASPLMDGPGFAREVEAAYREMWRGWCAAS